MSALTPAAATDLFRAPPERFVDVGEGEAALRVVGDGPDVLFVHGWPVSGATFRHLLPHLAPRLRCHVIDLPGAGDSRFGPTTTLTVDQHVETVRRVIDAIDAESVAVVGHDSGGLIARHAVVDHPKVRALGLVDTEQPQGLTWRFRAFLAGRRLPGFGTALGWAVGRPALRRNGLLLGHAFLDRSLLDGEFDELFLQPLARSSERRAAAERVLRSFRVAQVEQLAALHPRIEVPVALAWGEADRFFPVAWAREMVGTFPHATLTVIPDAGLFAHEERPAEVATALLPTLVGA